jgi:hypothetical protein
MCQASLDTGGERKGWACESPPKVLISFLTILISKLGIKKTAAESDWDTLRELPIQSQPTDK